MLTRVVREVLIFSLLACLVFPPLLQHDKGSAAQEDENMGVDLSELEAAGFAGVTNRVAVTDSGSAGGGGGSHGALTTTSSRLLSAQYSVYERSYDEEISFVMPQRYKDVLAKPPANSRSSSLRRKGYFGGGFAAAASAGSSSEDAATFTTASDSLRSNSFGTVDLSRSASGTGSAALGGGFNGFHGFSFDNNSDSETVCSANSPAARVAGSSARRKQQQQQQQKKLEYRDRSGTPPPPMQQQQQQQQQLACLSPGSGVDSDSLDGDESGAPSCLSVSTADELYESGSGLLMKSPLLPEGTLMAFASANSRSPTRLETSPIARAGAGAGAGGSSARRRPLTATVGDEIMDRKVEEEEEVREEEEAKREGEEEKRKEEKEKKKEEEEQREEDAEETEGGVVAARGGGGDAGCGGSESRKTEAEESAEHHGSSRGGGGLDGSPSSPSLAARGGDDIRPEHSPLLSRKASSAGGEVGGEDEDTRFLGLSWGDDVDCLGPAAASGSDAYASERVNIASISPGTDVGSTMSCFSPVVPLQSTKDLLLMAQQQLQEQRQLQEQQQLQEQERQHEQQQQQQAMVSPADSSLSGLSFGALSNMLQMTHGGDATIPAAVPPAHGFAAAGGPAATAHPTAEPDDGDMCYSPDAGDPGDGDGSNGDGDGGDSKRMFSGMRPPALLEKGSRGGVPAEGAAEAGPTCPPSALPAGVAESEGAATEPSAPAAPPDSNTSGTASSHEKPPAAAALDDMCYSPPSTGTRAVESRDDDRLFSLSPALSPAANNSTNTSNDTSKIDSSGDPFPQLAGYSPDCSRVMVELYPTPFSVAAGEEPGQQGTAGFRLPVPYDFGSNGGSGAGGAGGGGGAGVAGSAPDDFSTVCTTLTLSDVHGGGADQPLYCSPPSTSGGTPGVTPGVTPTMAASCSLEEGRGGTAARPVL